MCRLSLTATEVQQPGSLHFKGIRPMASWKLILIIAPILVATDLVWLGIVMKPFYQSEIGELARRNGAALAPRWPAGVLVWILIPTGIVLFVRPALGSQGSLLQAFAWGAVFGLILYGVFDGTNRSILDKWPLRLAIVDTAWGCVLCGVGACAMRLFEKLLSN